MRRGEAGQSQPEAALQVQHRYSGVGRNQVGPRQPHGSRVIAPTKPNLHTSEGQGRGWGKGLALNDVQVFISSKLDCTSKFWYKILWNVSWTNL